MKTQVVLLSLILTGCASRPTLEQLKQEALDSGDWTKVQIREKSIQRHQTDNSCPDGYTLACVDGFADERCVCVSPTGRMY